MKFRKPLHSSNN